MPIYEYTCSACGLKFEQLRPFRRANEECDCPRCEKPAERKLSTFASFSKDSSGASAPIAGSGSSCASCGGGSCATCH